MRTRTLAGLWTLVLVLAGVTTASTACQIGNAATRADPARSGGTLRLVVAAKPTHLDPQRVRTATEANLSRLITRTLTTYRLIPGTGTTDVVGDLATDAGRPSEGNRVWEFTLKPGLKWEDGNPITCDDVKYGVERGFGGGPFAVTQPYARQFLQDNAVPYQGPLAGDNNAGKGLESVQCLAVDTIVFQLRYPVSDFGRMVAATVFAPVPARQDTGERYDEKPFSSGPYRIQSIEANGLRYIRNPYWSRGTDSVRKAFPDQIVVSVSSDAETLTDEIVGSEEAWTNAVLLDQDIAASSLTRVIADRKLSDQVITGPSDGATFLAINTRRVPATECRRALNLAANRRAFRDALGGSFIADYATTALSPRLKGSDPTDPLGVLSAPEGDPEAAKRMIERTKVCPATVRVAFPDRRDVRSAVTSMVDPFRAAGVQVELRPVDPDKYWDLVGPAISSYELVYVEWMPDWPSGAAVLPQLFDGRLLPAGASEGILNLSLLNDQGINEAITTVLNEGSPDRQREGWAALDERIQAAVPTIPLLYPKPARVVGKNVRGGALHPRFGQVDVCALGLADPSLPRG